MYYKKDKTEVGKMYKLKKAFYSAKDYLLFMDTIGKTRGPRVRIKYGSDLYVH